MRNTRTQNVTLLTQLTFYTVHSHTSTTYLINRKPFRVAGAVQTKVTDLRKKDINIRKKETRRQKYSAEKHTYDVVAKLTVEFGIDGADGGTATVTRT